MANLPWTDLSDIGDPTFFGQAEKRVGVVFEGHPIAGQCANNLNIRFQIQKRLWRKDYVFIGPLLPYGICLGIAWDN